MKKPVLVIMAAGLGSRFGGLKQIAPVDEYGHIIIDYSIYDAVRAGFEDVIVIVKPECEAQFREIIGSRVAPFARLKYARQSISMLPEGFSVPEGRVRPWGTAHAVLCAKDLIDGPFAVINADDFYGAEAYQVLYRFLNAPHAPTQHAMVSYFIENTLTDNGHVARGVCQVDDLGRLTSIRERTHIEPRPGGAAYTEDGEHFTFIPAGTVVSLNFWGFQRGILDEIERRFSAFLKERLPVNPLTCEYYLPSVPDQLISEGRCSVSVLRTNARWYGVTYREDMPKLCRAIEEYRRAGLYPANLWARSDSSAARASYKV